MNALASATRPHARPAEKAGTTAPPRPLRVGLVGCGRLAEVAYLPAIAALERLRLVAVADPDPDRARLLSLRAAGTPRSFAGAERMLNAVALDAVLVCSPVDTHLDAARTAAAAGLPALIEKPPARDGEDAAELAELDPAPWVSFNRRFTHGRALLAGVPPEGAIELEISIAYRRRSWRPLGDLGDALLDLGPHAIDLAMLLCGQEGQGLEVGAAELSETKAHFELGCERWHSRIDLAVDRRHRERIIVRRPDGPALASYGEGGLRSALRGRLRPAEHPLLRSIREQLAAFAATFEGEPDPLLAGAADGARVMAVIDRVREAAER